jgi:hypothetical protein
VFSSLWAAVCSFNSTEMLTAAGMTRSTSRARLGSAMSISFCVCRAKFEVALRTCLARRLGATYCGGENRGGPDSAYQALSGAADRHFGQTQKANHNSRNRTHNRGKGFRREPQLAPPKAGRDQLLRRCLDSLSRAYGRATICLELASIGPVVIHEAGPRRRAED